MRLKHISFYSLVCMCENLLGKHVRLGLDGPYVPHDMHLRYNRNK